MPPVVFVTSSGAGEGKSTTSYALAQGLARLDKRVVLIDVDLRRPAQHRAFGLSNDEGMSDLLTSHREVGSVIRPTDVANLSFIPAGPIPPSPTELPGKNGRASCRERVCQYV